MEKNFGKKREEKTGKRNDGKNTKQYVHLFVLDVVDRGRSGVCIIGKEIVDEAAAPTSRTYRSCCISIPDVETVSYAIPRPENTAQEVLEEISEVAKRAHIDVRGNARMRHYAFGCPDIPCRKFEAMKLKSPPGSAYLMSALPPSGETYTHICMAHKSGAERLMLRQWIGNPAWIHVTDCVPVPRHEYVTRCAVEYTALIENVFAKCLCPTIDRSRGCDLTVAAISLRLARKNNKKTIISGAIAYETHPDCLSIGTPSKTRTIEIDVRSVARSMIAATVDVDVLVGMDTNNEMLPTIRATIETDTSTDAGIGAFLHVSRGVRELAAGRIVCDITDMATRPFPSLESYDIWTILDRLGGKAMARSAPGTCGEAVAMLETARRLQCLTLPLEIAVISGTTWATSARLCNSEIAEMMLLKKFHDKDYLCPASFPSLSHQDRSCPIEQRKRVRKQDGEDNTNEKKKKTPDSSYRGGLVLNVTPGIKEGPIAVFDFCSLYPSIIAEHDLCFTTIRTTIAADGTTTAAPPEPRQRETKQQFVGILSRVMWKLVERRAAVRKEIVSHMNTQEKERQEVRQLALKLVANSLYGCIGLPGFRFYMRHLAELITSIGRDSLCMLSRFVGDNDMEVVYGDTDSVFVRWNGSQHPQQPELVAKELAGTFSSRYRYMRVAVEMYAFMFFRSMKKYASWSLSENAVAPTVSTTTITTTTTTTTTITTAGNGNVGAGGKLNVKGMDVIRRDWCPIAKRACMEFLNAIGTGMRGAALKEHALALATASAERVRSGTLPPKDYAIAKCIGDEMVNIIYGKRQPTRETPEHVLAGMSEWEQGSPLPPKRCIVYLIANKPNESNPVPIPLRIDLGTTTLEAGVVPSTDHCIEKQLFPALSRLIVSAGIDVTDNDVELAMGIEKRKGPNLSVKLKSKWNPTGKFDFIPHVPLSIRCATCKKTSVAGWKANGCTGKDETGGKSLACNACGTEFPIKPITESVSAMIRELKETGGWPGLLCSLCGKIASSPIIRKMMAKEPANEKETHNDNCASCKRSLEKSYRTTVPVDVAVQFSYLRYLFAPTPYGIRPKRVANVGEMDRIVSMLVQEESSLADNCISSCLWE